MGHQQPQPREHLTQPGGHLLNALHPRHHIEHLPAAIELLADRTAHRLFIQRGQVGLDRTAQRRWGGDQAHLTHTRKAHVERARNRRCRERQDINVFA